MKIVVIGAGYVGLTTAVGLADFGCEVLCADIDNLKIEKLKLGQLPFYEPGMQEVMQKNMLNNRLSFSTEFTAIHDTDVVFIAVGTPQINDGEADLSYVIEAANMIGTQLSGYTVVVTKSTVPVGTNELIKEIILKKIADKECVIASEKADFDMVSNPEFLREGRALYDFFHPDRVVLGSDSDRPIDIMKQIYRPLYLNEVPFVFTDLKTAEIIKYSSNCFLATKVAFINEMARLCDSVGADIKAVAYAMGKDGRIGNKFLHPGPGYGGSCFPKDTEALAFIGREKNAELLILEAVIASNKKQKLYAADKIITNLNNHKNPTVGVLGAAFKSETDDMRESPAISIINKLLENNFHIKLYDPQAIDNARKIWNNQVEYCSDEYQAADSCDALVILTEWNQFRNLKLQAIRRNMRGNKFFDFRNIYNSNEVEKYGFEYIGLGTQ